MNIKKNNLIKIRIQLKNNFHIGPGKVLLLEKIEGSDPILRRSDMAEFYKKKEKQFSEFKNLSDTSRKRINSVVLSMLREMGLLVGTSQNNGDLGTLQRYNLSTQSRELIDNEREIYSGFLLK